MKHGTCGWDLMWKVCVCVFFRPLFKETNKGEGDINKTMSMNEH
jgi:hypothetical protein